MSKSRIKLFLENMVFYGGLSVLTKALPLITLPIITKLLPDTSSYGIADMFNLLVSFGGAIAVLGVYDAIFREYFEMKDDKEYQKRVTATGLNIVMISSTIVFIIIFVFSGFLSELLFKNIKYKYLIKVSGFVIFLSSVVGILRAPSRMKNKRKIFLYTGVCFPLIGFGITYILINRGLTYEALIYGTLVMNLVSLITFYFFNRNDFNFKVFDKRIAKELFKIGLPLIPTVLIYWIFNSMDRIMINNMLGAKELGVYSIGSRVASVNQLIYTAFSGGFAYFKYSTMKDNDQIELNSSIFEYLGIISFLSFILSFPFVKPVFNLLFVGEYINGSTVFPFLFLSPLLLMIYQVIGSQFIIIKKSYLNTLSLLIGAIFNVVLNFFLIRKFGIKGAAFSTLLSYAISVFFVCLIAKKYEVINISFRFKMISFLMMIATVLYFIVEIYYYYYIILVIILYLYLKDFKKIKEVKN